jgi:hypothetical protein
LKVKKVAGTFPDHLVRERDVPVPGMAGLRGLHGAYSPTLKATGTSSFVCAKLARPALPGQGPQYEVLLVGSRNTRFAPPSKVRPASGGF